MKRGTFKLAAIAGAAFLMVACSEGSAQGEKAAQGGEQAADTKAKPADVKKDGSYSLGIAFGTQLKGLGLTGDAIAMDQLSKGIQAGLSGKAELSPEDDAKVMAMVQGARAAAAETNKAAAKKFLAENGKKKDVVTTESGLQYRIIEPGSGESPKPTDMVTVHYRGTLLDGTEFDSSHKRGEPASFPVNGVIQGWQEALVMMKPGAKWELFIPPELAYDVNSPPAIPPGSLLRFDVELLNVAAPGSAQPEMPPGHP